MAKKNYVVGAEIEAYCTACKEDRGHVIETLKSDGNINKVNCGHCKGSHLFRRPKSEAAKKAARKPRKKKGAVAVTEAELKKAKSYSMEGVFDVGDVIKHTTFGPGKVVEMKANKMEVGFEDGAKLLVCRNK
jgi:hypothetical protein